MIFKELVHRRLFSFPISLSLSLCINRQLPKKQINAWKSLERFLSRPRINICSFFSRKFRIDDIEDNSCLRRGVPVAHSIYGVASTINAANYVFFLALEKVQHLGHADVSAHLVNLLSTFRLHLTHFPFSLFYFLFFPNRQPKSIRNNCWNCIGVRAWRFIGVIISHVPPSPSTNKWQFEKLVDCSCWPFDWCNCSAIANKTFPN